MNDLTLPAKIGFELPLGWARIPDDAADVPSWIDGLVAHSTAMSAESVWADLGRVAAVSLADTTAFRTGFAYLRSESAGLISAYLTVTLFRTESDGYERYFEQVDPSTAKTLSTYARRVSESTLAGEPAVVVQDFIPQVGGPDTTSLQERYLAAVFPRVERVIVEFQITTPDLALFGDIVEYGDAIVDTLVVTAADE